jgi:hypothetical protein
MTHPSYPGQLAPGQTAGSPVDGNRSGNGSANPANRYERNARPQQPAPDKGQFSYETVSPPRPGVAGRGPGPDATAAPTLAPPAPGGYGPGGPGGPGAGGPGAGGPGGAGGQGGQGAPSGPVGPGGQPSAPAARKRTSARTNVRSPRRARLQLRHINPWTVFKFACVLSVALFFIWLLTVAALYGVLDAAGAIGKINDAVTTINGSGSTPPVRPSLVFVGAMLIGAVNIVLFIALSTIGSVVYNLCADLIGGVEVTLSERES